MVHLHKKRAHVFNHLKDHSTRLLGQIKAQSMGTNIQPTLGQLALENY
jgi:hypothetical protein